MAGLGAAARRSTSGSTSPAAAICCSRPTPRTSPRRGSSRCANRSEAKCAAIPRVAIGDISVAGGQLSFMVRDRQQGRCRARAAAAADHRRGHDRAARLGHPGRRRPRFVLTPTKAGLDAAINTAMDDRPRDRRQAHQRARHARAHHRPPGHEPHRRRVPGLEDPQALKELIGQTAKLEFKLVNENPSIRSPRQGIARRQPDPSLCRKAAADRGLSPVSLSGDQLVNATMEFDAGRRGPASASSSTARAPSASPAEHRECRQALRDHRRRRGDLGAGVQRADPGRQARSSRQLHPEIANQLAIALRSGKLPVELKVVEERTICAELGRIRSRRACSRASSARSR